VPNLPSHASSHAPWLAVAGVSLAILALAFVVAPRACEGGLELYFWVGVLALVGLFALPVVTRTDRSMSSCFGYGLLFVLIGVGAWLAGMILANVRIICRLF
jgi:hypothetical protein